MTRKVVAFIALCTVCIVAAVGYAVFAGQKTHRLSTSAGVSDSGAGAPSLAELTAMPHLVYTSTAVDADFGKVAVADLAAPGRFAVSDLSCERVDFSADRGVCLHADRGAITTYATIIFDRDFHRLFTISLPGLPSRARVSPDGRYGATTTFVYGDSYAADTFSTRTELLDLHSGTSLGDLEQFTVLDTDGNKTENVDHNFWGVTFAQDSNLFYATLRTGGHTYLVKGDVGARTVSMLRGDVECPSLSPDGTHIAYKKRVQGDFGRVEWRLSVLDVATLQDHPLAETRNVDDQAEWLDDQTVLYSLNHAAAGTPTKDTWSVPADGSGSPSEYLAGAYSTGVVRS